MSRAHRGRALTIFAILFWVLAVSNLGKPLQLGERTGFVFFGQRLDGVANAVAGPVAGLYLAVYAYGIWTMRRWALPMGHAYATYVVLNLILFAMRNSFPSTLEAIGYWVIYVPVAVGVSLGAAVLLTQRKAELT